MSKRGRMETIDVETFEFILCVNGNYDDGVRAIMRIPGYPSGVSYDRPFQYDPAGKFVSSEIIRNPGMVVGKTALLCMKFGKGNYKDHIVPLREIIINEIKKIETAPATEIMEVYFTMGKMVNFLRMKNLLHYSQLLKGGTNDNDLNKLFHRVYLEEGGYIRMVDEDNPVEVDNAWHRFANLLFEEEYYPEIPERFNDPILLQIKSLRDEKTGEAVNPTLLDLPKSIEVQLRKTHGIRVCSQTYGYELRNNGRYIFEVNYIMPYLLKSNSSLTEQDFKEFESYSIDLGETMDSEQIAYMKVTAVSQEGIIKFKAIKPEEKYMVKDNIFEMRFRSYPTRHIGNYSVTNYKTGKQKTRTLYVPSTSIFFRIIERWEMERLVAASILLCVELILVIALWLPEKAAAIIPAPQTAFQVLGTLSLLFIVPTIAYLWKLSINFRDTHQHFLREDVIG
jgi:hypothetical protein